LETYFHLQLKDERGHVCKSLQSSHSLYTLKRSSALWPATGYWVWIVAWADTEVSLFWNSEVYSSDMNPV
jgi:hypothetical protein